MGPFSNRIDRGSLKPGDHIYTWNAGWIYSHHGIYDGDGKVIHFTRHGQKPKFSCSLRKEGFGVVSSSLNCFLSGRKLYRFEYGVSPSLFLAKVRGGTCTMARSDPDDVAIHRAKYLLASGVSCYNLFANNCENFAIYCKTGLLGAIPGTMGQSGQVHSLIVVPISLVYSIPAILTGYWFPVALFAIYVYCGMRYVSDIGKRSNDLKVSVEDLKTTLNGLNVSVEDLKTTCRVRDDLNSIWVLRGLAQLKVLMTTHCDFIDKYTMKLHNSICQSV